MSAEAGGRMARAALAVALAAAAATAWLWVRMDRDLGRLAEDQRQLAADLADARQTPTIDVAGAPALGPDAAVVTLVEFSDYECPFCIRHFEQTMPQIEAAFIRTGRIRYVFLDFPVDQLHPEAIRAHAAARCAGEQGRFWALHRRLFGAPGTHAPDALERHAAEAGVNLDAYRACVDSGRVVPGIRAATAQAVALGANGTPAFFIGLRDTKTDQVRVVHGISGAQPYRVFEQALETILARVR